MPLIALEGPDGSGKSTLAAEIARQLSNEGWRVECRAFGPPPFDPNNSAPRNVQAFVDYLHTLTDHTRHSALILDRFHWGAAVWGPIFRPQHVVEDFGDITKEHFFRLESLMIERGGVTALVTNDVPILVERVMNRGDDMAPTDDVGKLTSFMYRVQDLYNSVLSLNPPSAAPVPIVLDDPEDTVTYAKTLIDITMTRTARLS